MGKQLSQETLNFIFNHCYDNVKIPALMLEQIKNSFDINKNKLNVFKEGNIEPETFIKGYAKVCLENNRNIQEIAQKAFIKDLCKDEALIEYILHQSFFYQFSDTFFESLKKFDGPWQDPDAEKYGYPELARIALSLMIFCINVAKIGWQITITSNAISIAGTTIDCSKFTDNPRINSFMQTFLKEMIPLAIYMGTSQFFKNENVDGDTASSESVAIYAFFEYMFTRIMFSQCAQLRDKILGGLSPLNQYMSGQFIFSLSFSIFQYVFPKTSWLSFPPLEKCLKPEHLDVISQYFDVTKLNTSPVNITLLQKYFHEFSKNSIKYGKPINEEVTHIVNSFYDCARK